MKEWWKETVFYEIYMPSFKDGNGDGLGDFKGITEKLSYLSELGIGGIWLTPFYKSPRIDNGYDISDYKNIDPIYGTEQDFNIFLQEAHNKGIKVIVDLVINHTSIEHEWFKESAASRTASKRDWYIWKDMPNNWESFFGGSAWEYDKQTNQYYYHSFAREQADLNWNNLEVQKAVFDVIDYWLKRGIDGFRLDVINNLTLRDSFPDNPIDKKHHKQIHMFDKNQEGIIETIKEIASFIKNKTNEAFTVGEISSDEVELIASYSEDDLLDVTFNFNFGSIEDLDINYLFEEMKKMEEVHSNGNYPTLFFGSHDMGRLWTRLASEKVETAELLAALMLTAKGVPFIYFGDEIGMEDFVAETTDDLRDIQGIMAYRLALIDDQTQEQALKIANEKTRDKARAPMPWEDDSFSTNAAWIPSAPKVGERRHRLSLFYKKLIRLRKMHALSYETYVFLKLQKQLLYFQRGSVLVLLNFGLNVEKIKGNWKVESVLLTNASVEWSNTEIEIPALSVAILTLR